MAPTRWRAASRLGGQRDYAGSVQTQPEAVDLAAMAAIDAARSPGAKRTLRKAILFRRDSRSNKQREHDDASRMAMIESSLEDRIPDTVAAYLSTGSEPGTSSWSPGWRRIASACCCRCCRTRLAVVSTSRRGRRTRPDAARWRLLNPGTNR